MKKLIIILSAILIASCTEQNRAKNWGGTEKVWLPKNKKLVNITWKETQIWYLTREMNKEDKAETYYFHEKSSWGMIEGTIVVYETKDFPKESKGYPWQHLNK